jgi:hypothetical protein
MRTHGRFTPWGLDNLDPMQRAFIEESVMFRLDQESELAEMLEDRRR